jgi:hypothetical protein
MQYRETPSLSTSSAASQTWRVYLQPESMPLRSLTFENSTDAYMAHFTKTQPWVSFEQGRKIVLLNEQMIILASFVPLNVII